MVRMWDDQLERMERYYRRCEEIKSRGSSLESVEDDNDTVYSFFIHCYHLKDWFRRDSLYQHEGKLCANPKCAECYFQNNEALKLCGEFCNGIKHLNSLSPEEGRDKTPALPGRGTNHVDNTAWLFIIWADWTYSDPFNAVAAARNAWKKFALQTGAVDSPESYEKYYASRSSKTL